MKTLILTQKEIKSLISIKEVVKVVERAFREKGLGRVEMPAKLYLFYPKYQGDLRLMPAYFKKLDISGVKIVNVHPQNPGKFGLPTVMATICLIDPRNGYPIAIMDGTYITALRTGASSAVASKYLAPKETPVVGMIGAGIQARTQLLAMAEVKKIKLVKVFDIKKETVLKYIQEMKRKTGLEIKLVKSIKEAVENSQIVITTTPSRKPIVKNEWIKAGVHINTVGADAPGKEELDPKILKRAKVVLDDWQQGIHSGEVNVPLSKGLLKEKEIYGEIGQIVAGKKKGRISDKEITVFCATGLAINDVITANLVYQKAKKKKIGRWIELL